jgi:hypothetical protein
MTETRDLDISGAPSPVPPTEAERMAWNALARDEQIARYREYFAHVDCKTFTHETPDEILATARAQTLAGRGG